ncbi:hypothetical protein HAX54_044930, partial [Datura stramonium]|nr:hypothetical protein [Datura stramonium]
MEVRLWVLFPVEGGGVRWLVCYCCFGRKLWRFFGGQWGKERRGGASGRRSVWLLLLLPSPAVKGERFVRVWVFGGCFSGGGKVRGDGGYGVFRFIGRGEREKEGARGSPEIMK